MNSRTLTTLQLSIEKRLATPLGFKDAGTTIQLPRHSERRDCHGEAPPATRGSA
jgi:hypothetical protein